MSFKLTVLGCGSAIPNLVDCPTSQLLNVNERFFLLDCGEGTQVQLKKYGINLQRISHIFISHLHGDHYFGLIGLINSMHLLNRNKELHVYAHTPLKAIIDAQLKISSTELRFPLFFHEISLVNQSILFEDETVIVENIILDHTLSCSGFIFTEKKSNRKIIKHIIEKLNIPYDKINSIKNGADWIDNQGNIIKNDEITEPNTPPNTYAFCTDTSFKKLLVDSIKGVDLLYHEATFKKDMQKRAIETGHSTTYDASRIAKMSDVKCLMIGHISQRYKNKQELLQETKMIFNNSILAYSGLTIDFKDLLD
tara:strand:+ start:118 stop:1044 length:927 start_codon:yes stop_codon:yes gene_type:complete